jgi:glutathione S-transferase
MKLYMHPVSMTSRPIRLFIAENNLKVEEELVDLMVGQHYSEAFVGLNPNRQVPVFEDGDLRLTESSAILKYLADKIESPAYPKDLKQRARVNELMDWFNTGFYRDFGYGLCYPQIFPHHKRPIEDGQSMTLSWGKDRAQYWFKVLDEHWLGKDGQYVAGSQATIADYFGVCLVTLGDILRVDLSAYPNVVRWIGNMKKLKTWESVNKELYGFAGAVKDQPFVTL